MCSTSYLVEAYMAQKSKRRHYREMLTGIRAVFIMAMSEREITLKHADGTQKTIFRPDTYSNLDNKGFMGGGHASCIAAAELWQFVPEVSLVTTSAPEKDPTQSLAKIYADELMRNGVGRAAIQLEERSTNLLTELVEMVKIACRQNWKGVAVLTNENQLDRARAMMDNLGTLAERFGLNDKEFLEAWAHFAVNRSLETIYISAEEVLLTRDYQHYFPLVDTMRKSEAYKKRVESETRGAAMVRDGSYGQKRT